MCGKAVPSSLILVFDHLPTHFGIDEVKMLHRRTNRRDCKGSSGHRALASVFSNIK